MTPIRTTGPDPVPLSASSNLRHLVNPLLTVAVYYLVFGVFLKANRGIDNYLRRLTVDVFTFGLTTRSILDGATSITANVGLMPCHAFPPCAPAGFHRARPPPHVRLRTPRDWFRCRRHRTGPEPTGGACRQRCVVRMSEGESVGIIGSNGTHRGRRAVWRPGRQSGPGRGNARAPGGARALHTTVWDCTTS
jgi:hypothetical protein